MLRNPAKIQIPFSEIDWSKLKFPEFFSFSCKNQANLYTMTSNKPGLVFFEMVFQNGRIAESKKQISRVVANQIQEGTLKIKGSEVVDTLDYYGAQCTMHADLDFTVFSMSCLQKHFKFLAEFLVELVLHPAFREEDLEKAKVFYISQLQHQLMEPDYLSYREFTAHVYGQDRVYGYNSTINLFKDLNTGDLRDYHKNNFKGKNLKVFYCGDTSTQQIDFLKGLVDQFSNDELPVYPKYVCDLPFVGTKHFSIPNCAQTSLKIGCKTFPKEHPDFYPMYILNTILGDYFGSRLMKNIREEEGLSYDISSTVDAQKLDGCFYISAELSPDQLFKAKELIFKELEILKHELIPDSELKMVQNYLCGHLMRLLDGPFQSIVFLKILMCEYNSANAFDSLLQCILNINSRQLRDIAQKHLPDKNWTIITAGAGV